MPHALADVREILANRAQYFGERAAHDLEEYFLDAFARLAANPGLGHRRSDLTRRPYFFYTLDLYLVVHLRQADPLPILGVLHSSRDIRKVLKWRPGPMF